MLRILKTIGRNTIAAIAKRYGYALAPIRGGEELTYSSNAKDAYRRIAKRGFPIQTVVDIGASDGRWSADCMHWFPDARYLLVEAQEVHREALELFCHARENAEFTLSAASDRVGEIYFDASDPFGGQASDTPYPENNVTVRATTIDHEVASRSLPAPYLLKFDTHGFELPILRGADSTLARTELIVMECYNFQLADGALLFHEMCQHLAELGFRVIDLYDPSNRARDGAFWQMDLVFARSERPEFSYHGYR